MIGLGPLRSNACACAREGQRESAIAKRCGSAGQVAVESGSPSPEYEPPERRRSKNAVCDGGHDNREETRGGMKSSEDEAASFEGA